MSFGYFGFIKSSCTAGAFFMSKKDKMKGYNFKYDY